ncbi:MAG: HAD family hydrolase [Verrucomicrobiales bacterium]
MIRNFLFDIGNVLLAFDLTPAVARLNHRQDLTTEQATAHLVSHRDLMEAGKIPPEVFISRLTHDLAWPGNPGEAAAIYADIFTPILPNWELADNLSKRGFRLVLFSNISPIHSEFINTRYEVFSLFPEAIFSYNTGDIKPRDGMYREAVEKLGMKPEETFYIDDNPDNIATGKRFGFHTHLYDAAHHDSLIGALVKAGI